MKLIVCLDNNRGMLFHNRRQSSDKLVCQRICELTQEGMLWMNNYSGYLFAEKTPNIRIDEDFLSQAGENDYCFVENVDVKSRLTSVKTVIIFHWNRNYPADLFFPELQPDFTCVSSEEFPGNSHEKITMEVYSQ